MTREDALKKIETKFWENLTPHEIVLFQLYEERLCMPWEIFHEAVEKVLGRPVQTVEFAHSDNLKREFEKKRIKEVQS